jgi:hypothetical protein
VHAVKIDPQGVECELADCTDVNQVGYRWWILVNTGTELAVPYRAGDFFTR